MTRVDTTSGISTRTARRQPPENYPPQAETWCLIPEVRYFWSVNQDQNAILFSSVDNLFEPIEIRGKAEKVDFVFSADGKRAFAASGKRRVEIRLPGRQVNQSNNPESYPWPLYATAFSTDGTRFAEVRKIKKSTVMQIYDPVTDFDMVHEHKIDFQNRLRDEIEHIGFSPDNKRLFVASRHRLKIFEVATGQSVIEYDMADSRILPVAWRDDGILISANAHYKPVPARVIRLKVDE